MADDVLNEEVIELTEKQKLFVMLYLGNGFNATQAAIGAGYSVNTAGSIGAENLKKPQIKSFIKKECERLLTETDLIRLKWFNEVQVISFSDHNAKMRGLELLGKYLGMLKEDQAAGVTIIINTDETKLG